MVPKSESLALGSGRMLTCACVSRNIPDCVPIQKFLSSSSKKFSTVLLGSDAGAVICVRLPGSILVGSLPDRSDPKHAVRGLAQDAHRPGNSADALESFLRREPCG